MPGSPEVAAGFECCSDDRQTKILQYLKNNGERLDSEIAAEMGDSLEAICRCLSALSTKGDVIMCRTTRYSNGNTIEGMLCRASGFSPQASRGRKPNAQGKQG
jgi:hypothetical protein